MKRRDFSRLAMTCVLSTPIITAPMLAASAATTLPHLEESDETAAALGYKSDSTQVDAAKFPQHKPDQVCAACLYFQGGTDEWGPCAIFTGKAVHAKGWCSAFSAKAK